MSRITAVVLVLLCWSFAHPAAADPLLASIDILLQEPTDLVREWEVARYVSIAIVTVVVLLGAAIAVVHSLPMTISKAGAVILGSAVTLLTGLNNAYVDFDHRQYKAMATQGRLLLAEIKVKISELSQFPQDQQDARKAIFEQIRRHKNEILALPTAFKERSVRTAAESSLGELPGRLIPPAHAQAGRPEWITKAPVDDEHLYFLGDAQGGDYFGTVRASRRSAEDQARAYLAGRLAAPQPGGVDGASAAKYLLDSAKVASTHSSYHSKERTVRVYTLLAVSKRVADSDLRLFGATHAQQVLPVQQQQLKNSVRTQSEYLNLKR
ncbi:MAG: hypothetical protein ACYC0T_04495 [Ramlibacter sp.]